MSYIPLCFGELFIITVLSLLCTRLISFSRVSLCCLPSHHVMPLFLLPCLLLMRHECQIEHILFYPIPILRLLVLCLSCLSDAYASSPLLSSRPRLLQAHSWHANTILEPLSSSLLHSHSHSSFYHWTTSIVVLVYSLSSIPISIPIPYSPQRESVLLSSPLLPTSSPLPPPLHHTALYACNTAEHQRRR